MRSNEAEFLSEIVKLQIFLLEFGIFFFFSLITKYNLFFGWLIFFVFLYFTYNGFN